MDRYEYYFSLPGTGDFEVSKETFENFVRDCEHHFQVVKLNSPEHPEDMYYYLWSITNDFQYFGYTIHRYDV